MNPARRTDGGRSRTVLVVFHEEIAGGATLSVLRLIDGLEELGWRFAFWVERPSELDDMLRARGYAVTGARRTMAYSMRALRLPPGPRARIRALPSYFRAYRSALREFTPALVHANSLVTLAEGAVARTCGSPVLFHVHEMVVGGRKAALTRRAAHRVGTEVVAVSEASAQALAIGDWRPRIVHECAPVPAEAAPGSGLEDGAVVGTVGVVSRRKGSDLFVEAARIVRERRPEIEFRLVGSPTDPLDAEWAAGVLRYAREVGVVHVPRADVLAAFREWDVFVLPSRRDPFPISMLEAMGSSLPVVGTRVDGLAEQIAPGTGTLVPPDDPAALAEAILALCDVEADERRQIGAAARRRVLDNFTISHQVEQMHAAYLAATGD
jgi:glycosyltransferase involved in cell wall biosynthesis